MQRLRCRKCGRVYWEGERHICAGAAAAEGEEAAEGAQYGGGHTRALIIVGVVGLVLVLAICFWQGILPNPGGWFGGNQQATSLEPAEEKDPELLVVEGPSFRHPEDSIQVTVSGRVQNITKKGIRGIWAVVDFYGRDGKKIKSETTPIECDPINSNEVCFWQVMTLWDENMVGESIKVSFKCLSGYPIHWIEQRRPQ